MFPTFRRSRKTWSFVLNLSGQQAPLRGAQCPALCHFFDAPGRQTRGGIEIRRFFKGFWPPKKVEKNQRRCDPPHFFPKAIIQEQFVRFLPTQQWPAWGAAVAALVASMSPGQDYGCTDGADGGASGATWKFWSFQIQGLDLDVLDSGFFTSWWVWFFTCVTIGITTGSKSRPPKNPTNLGLQVQRNICQQCRHHKGGCFKRMPCLPMDGCGSPDAQWWRQRYWTTPFILSFQVGLIRGLEGGLGAESVVNSSVFYGNWGVPPLSPGWARCITNAVWAPKSREMWKHEKQQAVWKERLGCGICLGCIRGFLVSFAQALN